ncbi:DUF2256 domain-containing protein [uncultured Thalassospira sp.]|uniref:DUF2256 domain-containing protein n=1 Tax=uncultured Thalassospira sp. TaxID=404382 RepID=UPI0030D9DCCD
MKKHDLPTKTCPVCHRPFSWRKKWAENWHDVKYCSNRCRREKNSPGKNAAAPSPNNSHT